MFQKIIIACVLAASIRAAPHEKIAIIFKDFDYNGNDNINQNEVIAYFQGLKVHDSDVMISLTTFLQKWSKKYGDTAVVSEIIYRKMDINNDGLLTNADIPLFYSLIDKNRNGIEWAEFQATFNSWYAI